MFTWKRFILASSITLLLALIFITLILPGQISDRASSWVATETGRTLEIGSISINPFSLSVEVHNLHLSDVNQAKSFVSWDLLSVSLSMSSLYHRAPIIDKLRLDNPSIHLEKLAADRFNFSDLIPEKKDTAPAESTDEPTRFSVNNISISGGQIDLIDSSLEKQVHHTIRELQLVLPAIGNLPYMVENPARPLFQAVVNDSPINLEGKLKPFTSDREMQFGLVLENIDLPFYLGYVPVDLPIELRNGKLNLDLNILYRITAESGGELELSGRIDLTSLDVFDRLQERLFFLPLLQIELAPSQPLNQKLHLAALRIYNLEVQLKRDSQGEWNHARMAQKGATQETQESPEENAKEATPFKLLVDAIEIHDGSVVFADSLPVGGFETVAQEINIDIRDFALDGKQGIPLNLSLKTDRDESVKVSGHFLLDPFTLALQTELHNIPLGAYKPYYQDVYNKPFGGTLELGANLLINPEQTLLISNGKLAVRDFYGAFNDEEGISISQFDITGLGFNLAENRLGIDSINVTDSQANFSRDSDGEWSFISRNFPILAKLAETSNAEPESQTESEGPVFTYHVGDLAINNFNIVFHDKQPATPARIEINDLTLAISNLAAPEKTKSPFTFSMTLQHKGQVELKGSTSLSDQESFVSARLKNLPLATVSPYIAEQANLILADGSLNARLNASVLPVGKSLQVDFDGNLGVSRMHLLDGTHKEDLLKWDSLQIAGIKGDLTPLTLAIGSITLSDYFAKILIDEEARLNLTEAFRNGSDEEAAVTAEETDQAAEKIEESAEATSTEPSDITIGKIVLQGGQVDFTDRHLPRPFHVDMRELGGRIDGLSSAADSRAEVDLRGNLRDQSPLNISGTVNPLADQLSLDISLSFRDIEMSPLSPYSSNFVGYLIEKGKLNLALDYFIEDNQLKASNKVFLDQFSFGEAVESEQAISLPVNLAVALLKDGNGEIHLDIPVFGSLDDPQFSISGVVWTVVKNLLVKAATSPFALLGALLGGGDGEDFSNISFEHGSAQLSTTEKDKLQRMAQALVDRPSLEVEVSGFIDPDHDAEGYRKQQLTKQTKRLKYLDLIKEEELPEGAKEEDVTIPVEEYADYLWQVYRKAKFPKPRNFIGMTKKLPEAEMEKLIYANTPVTQDQLAELAQARALAAKNFLIEEGQLAQERIFLKEPDITAAPDQETVYRARVELGATVR